MEEILTFISLIVLLALLGIVVSFSPTLVLTEVAVLLKSKRPFLHVAALIAGIATAVALLTALAMVFLTPETKINIPALRQSFQTGPFVDLFIGVALVILGARGLRRLTRHVETKPSRFSPENILTSKKLFVFGLVKMATSISSVLAILFASRFVKEVVQSTPSQLIAGLWLIVIALAPFVLLVLLRFSRPDSFRLLEAKLQSSTTANVKYLVFSLCVAFGAALILLALLHRDQSIFAG